MLCSLKMSSRTIEKKTMLLGKTHEIEFRDKGPTERAVDAEVEQERIRDQESLNPSVQTS